MIHTMDCQANITAQDANHPTYKKVDCTLHINANDDNFYGRLIDCSGSFNAAILILSNSASSTPGI